MPAPGQSGSHLAVQQAPHRGGSAKLFGKGKGHDFIRMVIRRKGSEDEEQETRSCRQKPPEPRGPTDWHRTSGTTRTVRARAWGRLQRPASLSMSRRPSFPRARRRRRSSRPSPERRPRAQQARCRRPRRRSSACMSCRRRRPRAARAAQVRRAVDRLRFHPRRLRRPRPNRRRQAWWPAARSRFRWSRRTSTAIQPRTTRVPQPLPLPGPA